MKTPFEIIERPIITEKSTAGQELEYPQYTFKVDRKANKREIRKSIETAFPNVTVRAVRSINMRGKMRRVRRVAGRTAAWKKAIVTLDKGQTIDLY